MFKVKDGLRVGLVPVVDSTGDILTNAATASRLKTPITISLTGDVTGSASTDLSSNTSITVTLANTNFTANNATNLNGQPASYYLDWDNFTDTPTTLSGYGITDAVRTSGDQTITGSKQFSNVVVTDATITNLTVTGTTTTVNSQTLDVADPIITVGSNNSGSTPVLGIKAERGGHDAYAVWLESSDRWWFGTANNDALSAGTRSTIEAATIDLNATTGTAPLTISSTTLVNNLNADLLDGVQGADYTRADLTYLGRTGNQYYDAVTNTAAEWSALPVGYSRMIGSGIGTSGGAPINNFGYFTKVAARDTLGGWGGLWVGYSAGQNYMGRAAESTQFPSWDKLWSDANDGSGSGLDADLLDGQEGSFYTNATNIISGTINNSRLPTSQTGKTFTSTVSFTGVGNQTGGQAQLFLNGTTSNRIDFGTTGVGPPTVTTRSIGTKLLLWTGLSSSATDYAVGIENNALWTSVPGTSQSFRWYANTTPIMTLSGTGTLWSSTDISAGNDLAAAKDVRLNRNDGTTPAIVVQNFEGFRLVTNSAGTARTITLGVNSSQEFVVNGNRIWHAANDGSGSGLDADLLDGNEGSFYQNASNLNAGTVSSSRLPSFSGDVSSTAGSSTLTLQTVNSNVGQYGSSTQAPIITVDGKGRITAVSSITVTPSWSSITSKPTTLAGFGITDAQKIVSFSPGSSGGSRRWGRLFTLNGVTPTGGANCQLILSNTGDYGAPQRGTIILHAAVRNGICTVKAYQFNVENTAEPIEFYTKQISTEVFEVWAKFPDYNHDHTAVLLSSVNYTPNWDSFGTVEPSDLVTSGVQQSNIWHSDNDGPSSGMNADLLDGEHGTYYQNASNIISGTISGARLPAYTGDVTKASGGTTLTLATVNSNVGNYGSATAAPIVTVNAKGLVTAVSTATITPAWSSITSKPSTLAGYGITDAVATSGDQTITGTKSFSGNVSVNSNFTVNGTVNLNGTSVEMADEVITIAKNSAGAAPYIGFKAERGATDAFWVWDESSDRFAAYLSSNDLTAVSSAPIQGSYLVSTIASGSAPLVVSSNTVVTNLNADLLDGLNSTSFLRSDTDDSMDGVLSFGSTTRQMINLYATTYGIGVQSQTTYVRTGNSGRFSVFAGGSHDNAANAPGSGGSVLFTVAPGSIQFSNNTVWHAGNDGTGSGLDADLLDGQHASYFAPLNSPALTGIPTAPTPVITENTTQVATTQFVQMVANGIRMNTAGWDDGPWDPSDANLFAQKALDELITGNWSFTGDVNIDNLTVANSNVTKTTISADPPDNPTNGDRWIDTDNGTEFVWFEDGDSGQWVEFESNTAPGPGVPAGGNERDFLTKGSGGDHDTVWRRARRETVVFSATGNHTFDVPAWATRVIVNTLAAGGGGGGGACGDDSANRFGGGGGASGGLSDRTFEASEISGTLNIYVGLGGSGGAGRSTAGSGGSGSRGEASYVSFNGNVICYAEGGDFGSGGTTSSGAAGNGLSDAYGNRLSGVNGGSSSVTNNGGTGQNSGGTGGGGGAGGGIGSATPTTERSGGFGGYGGGVLGPIGSGQQGQRGTPGGTVDGSNGGPSSGSPVYGGGGGGGGASKVSVNSGHGGHAAEGAGGGGGGASRVGYNSGNGGNGGNGIVWITVEGYSAD